MYTSFSHLHVRSGFSYGLGPATPEELVEAAAWMGYRSLALTDRDGLYGVPRFLAACEEHDLSPIVGAEITVDLRKKRAKERTGGIRGHLVLLAEDQRGYRSLCKLISSYRIPERGAPWPTAAERRNPSCPLEALLSHAEGLLCLTGAIPFGLVPALTLSRNTDSGGNSREILSLLCEAFGEGNVFVELTDDGTAGSRRRMRQLETLAGECGVPTAAAHEVTYLRPEDHRLSEALAAARALQKLPPPDYRPTDRLYLRSPVRMHKLFADRPEATRNTAEIADRCAAAVELDGELHIPAARLEKGESARQKLLALVLRGARERYGAVDEKIKSRLRRELSCIGSLGFTNYFLLAHEAREIACEMGTPVTGRGSAANCLVAYCLGLTQPEPFANGLIFERFMHEQRRDPPDIDIDMCSELRDPVRNELIRRYGGSGGPGVAVAATANVLSLRGAVRVACRALGYSARQTDELSRHVPRRIMDRDDAYHDPGKGGWEEALSEPAMRGHPLRDRRKYALLREISSALYGRLWRTGTHLGGMVFGTEELKLSELVPVEASGTEGLPRVQYDKDDLEFSGIPKLDLLGLRMHTALRKAGEIASRRSGRTVDSLSPPPADKATYRLIRTGRNTGMFQLESPGQMHLSRRLKPRKLSDLVAQISLFRPGPVRGDLVSPYVMRKNALENYELPLPELEPILRETFGVIVYQEQVLAVARVVAGFTLSEGDLLRRAMTKDRAPAAMRRLEREFLERAAARSVPREKAALVFEWISSFSAYGFPKAHAASFAELAYASAYMRCHYPAPYFCGLLNSQPMGFYSPRTLLNEARRVGLGVLPPDIHLSGEGFTVEDTEEGVALRVGLAYCKGLSKTAISEIVSERGRRPFASPADLYRRTSVGRDALENLVKGGYLDAFAKSSGGRASLLRSVARLPKKPTRKKRQHTQTWLEIEDAEGPGASADGHPADEWLKESGARASVEALPLPPERKVQMQREVLRLDVVGHPLAPYRGILLRELGVTPSSRMPDLPHGSAARAAGIIECLQMPPTRSGRPVYFLLIEDEWGLLQCTLFGRAYQRYGHLLHRAGAFFVEGRVEQDKRRGFSFLVERIADLGEILTQTRMPRSSGASSGSGALLRAGNRSKRRAG